MVRIIKSVLFKLGILGALSETKSKAAPFLRNGYDPRHFWDSWSDAFFGQKIQKDIHIAQKRILEKIDRLNPESVLEAGCGFGRNLNFFTEKEKNGSEKLYYGMDISLRLIEKARLFIKNRKNIRLACSDITDMPFKSASFDMVFTHGTLMHLAHEAAKRAVRELIRISRRDIILVEEVYWSRSNVKRSINANRYTFYHNYPAILRGLNVKTIEECFIDDAVKYIFIHAVKNDLQKNNT